MLQAGEAEVAGFSQFLIVKESSLRLSQRKNFSKISVFTGSQSKKLCCNSNSMNVSNNQQLGRLYLVGLRAVTQCTLKQSFYCTLKTCFLYFHCQFTKLYIDSTPLRYRRLPHSLTATPVRFRQSPLIDALLRPLASSRFHFYEFRMRCQCDGSVLM